MECRIFDSYIDQNDCSEQAIPEKLKRHIQTCAGCRKKLLVVRIMQSQKNVFEKAPETILCSVRRRINDLQESKKYRPWSIHFGTLLRPALAFTMLVIAIALWIFSRTSPIGVVDNLAQRFDIPALKYIKPGDLFYVAKNARLSLEMNDGARLQLDSNTLVQIKATDRIVLSRGGLYLADGKNRLKIETPHGTILLNHTKAVIRTTFHEQMGLPHSSTSCIVVDGSVETTRRDETIRVSQGREIVLTETGLVESSNALAEPALKKLRSIIDSRSNLMVISAKKQLCDCIYDKKYDRDNTRLHAEDSGERTFPVRIFWQNNRYLKNRSRKNESFCQFNTRGGGPGLAGANANSGL